MNPQNPSLDRQLRTAYRQLRVEAGSRRRLPTTFHLGTPGGWRLSLRDDASWDLGLRCDLVERLLDTLAEPTPPRAWLTRSGALAGADADFAWFGAASAAFARRGWNLPDFHVITLHGWFELREGHVVHRRR